MKISAVIDLHASPQEKEQLVILLAREAKKDERSKIAVVKQKSSIQISIESSDASSFRAQTNALTQLFSLFEKTTEL